MPFEALNSSLFNIQNLLPTVDGDFLQDSPLEQFATNQIAPINLILGDTSDEGIFFGPNTYNTTEQLAAVVEGSIGINDTIGQELLQLYPLKGPNPPYSVDDSVDWIKETASVGVPSGIQTRRSYAIFGDLVFIAGRRKMAAGWKLATGKRAYSFRFDTDPTRFPLVVTPGLGVGFAQHGSAIPPSLYLTDALSSYSQCCRHEKRKLCYASSVDKLRCDRGPESPWSKMDSVLAQLRTRKARQFCVQRHIGKQAEFACRTRRLQEGGHRVHQQS